MSDWTFLKGELLNCKECGAEAVIYSFPNQSMATLFGIILDEIQYGIRCRLILEYRELFKQKGSDWCHENKCLQNQTGFVGDKEKAKKYWNELQDAKMTDTTLDLNISDYPMNIRVKMLIDTNIGTISKTFDYPPPLSQCLGEEIQSRYSLMIEKLYDEHAKRGGKFIGDEGYSDWFDQNGKTIIQD